MPDVALLLHGMVLPQQQQQDEQQQDNERGGLFAVDSYGIDLQELLGSPGVMPEQPTPFEGTRGQTVAELVRLTTLLKNIPSEEQEKAAAGLQPAAEDWGGKLLQQLHGWRRQRVAAIEAEIARITGSVAELHGITADKVAAT
jgi:hypothetical protein